MNEEREMEKKRKKVTKENDRKTKKIHTKQERRKANFSWEVNSSCTHDISCCV